MEQKGVWIKYDFSKKEDIHELNRLLKNSKMKWKDIYGVNPYIDHIEIYVYYVLKDNSYTDPKILFKLVNGNKVELVKGDNEYDTVSYEYLDILKDKISFINTIPLNEKIDIDKHIYEDKMIYLLKNKIDNKYPLNVKDIKNLYVDCTFNGYNNEPDPRIVSIKKSRNIIKDYMCFDDLSDRIAFFNKNMAYFPFNSVADKEVILSCIKDRPYALQYACKSLKTDKNFIIELAKVNIDSFDYSDASLKKNISYISFLFSINSKVLKYASKTIVSNKKLMLSFLKKDPSIIIYVSSDFYSDLDFMKEAIKINKELSKYASSELLKNQDIAAAYLSYCKKTNWIDNDLLSDRNFILKTVVEIPSIILNVNSELKTNDFLLECIKRNINVLYYLTYELEDVSLAASIIKLNPYVLFHLAKYMNNEEYINGIIDALKINENDDEEKIDFKKDSINTLRLKFGKKID